MALLRTRVCGRMRLSTLLLFVILSAIFIFLANHSTSYIAKEVIENDILNPKFLKLQTYKQKVANKYHFDKDDNVPGQVCKVPKLSLKTDVNQFAFHHMEPLDCATHIELDLFSLENYALKIKPNVLNNRKLERCLYKAIEWETDSQSRFSDALERKAPGPFELKLKNEFFHVECYLEKQNGSQETDGMSSTEQRIRFGRYHPYDDALRRLLQTNDQPAHQERWDVASDMKIGEVVYGGNQHAKMVKDIVQHVHDHRKKQLQTVRENVIAGAELRDQLNMPVHHPSQQNQENSETNLKSAVVRTDYKVPPRYMGSMGLPDSPLIDIHAQQVYHTQKVRIGIDAAPHGISQQEQQAQWQQPHQNYFVNKNVPQQVQGQQFRAHGQGQQQNLALAQAQNGPTQDFVPGLNIKRASAQSQPMLLLAKGNEQLIHGHQYPRETHDQNVINAFAGRLKSKLSDVVQGFAGNDRILLDKLEQRSPTLKVPGSQGVTEKSIFLGKHAVEAVEVKTTVTVTEHEAKQEASKEVPSDKASEDNTNDNPNPVDGADPGYFHDYYNAQAFSSPDFEQFFAQIVLKDDVLTRIKELEIVAGEQMDVLIFAMDSMSHLTYQRKMPKTYEYIQKTLGSVVLNSYNIVGDATTAAIIPITTGHTEMELPEVRKNQAGSTYVDSYPLIWNKFQQHGYVTLFTEDKPDIAVFNLRLNGFEEIPVDHYMRPFYQALHSSTVKESSASYCTGSRPSHRYMLDYLRQYFERYPRSVNKFAFAFLNDLSHDDNNPAEYIDAELVSFLEGLRLGGHLDNTVVIIMADHGARYSRVRQTTQGKLEERLPMMSLAFPGWFQKKYPDLMRNLKTNADRLTTPFDIHATLLSVLDLKTLNRPAKGVRGLSLLRTHPLDRTCDAAGVDAHWCTCMNWQKIDPTNWRVVMAAKHLVEQLNAFSEQHRGICSELQLKKVVDVKIGLPNDKVLKFIQSVDGDARVANFSGDLASDLFYLQLIAETVPGNALFEGTVIITKKGTTYQAMPNISRINRYGDQAHCVTADHPDLRKFCYCKAPAPAPKRRPTHPHRAHGIGVARRKGGRTGIRVPS